MLTRIKRGKKTIEAMLNKLLKAMTKELQMVDPKILILEGCIKLFTIREVCSSDCLPSHQKNLKGHKRYQIGTLYSAIGLFTRKQICSSDHVTTQLINEEKAFFLSH